MALFTISGAGIGIYAGVRADLASLHAKHTATHDRLELIEAKVFK